MKARFDAPTMGILPSARLARVHLFRHAEVETGPARVCRGQADVPLSERGREQTEAAAERFRRAWGVPDRVISSDLARCVALAEAIGPAVERVPALREQDMGAWEGRTWEELTAADGAAVTRYWDDYVDGRPTGGETYGETFRRVVAWWEAADLLDQHVVVVTHVGVIRALLCHWLGLPPGQALRFAPAYASHTQVLVAEAGVVIERFGS